MRTQPLVPSSPHHREHTHCSRHLQQSLLAAATRPISTLGVLRKSSETALHRVRPIKVSEVQGCAHGVFKAQTYANIRPESSPSGCESRIFAQTPRRSVPALPAARSWAENLFGTQALPQPPSSLACSKRAFPDNRRFHRETVSGRRPMLLATVEASFQSRACRV